MTERTLDRRILSLAIPALGALAADPLLSLVDTAFVTRLGTPQLAALGIDAAIFSMALLIFNFLAYVTTPMVARLRGSGDLPASGRVVAQAIMLAVVLGAVVAAILVALAPQLVGAMQAAPDLVDPAVEYLRIRGWAAPAVLVVIAGHGAFRGFQDTRTPLVVAIGMNVLNGILDPILMFGLDMGLAGAATATLIAQVVGATWFVALLVRRGRAEGWSWQVPRLAELVPMMSTGGILAIRTVFLTGSLTVATAVAASFGVVEVAAHQVLQQVFFLLAMVADGLAIAAQAMVADESARRGAAAAGQVARRLFWWALWLGGALAMVVMAVRVPVATAFGPDPGVRAAIRSVLVVVAVLQPLATILFVADGVYLGLLQVRWLAASTLAGAGAAAGILVGAVQFGWGLEGVWWAIGAMLVVRAIVLGFAYPRVAPNPA